MTSHPEVLAFSCRPDDLAVLQRALGARGSSLLTIDSAADLARRALSGGPAAVFLGIGRETLSNLSVVPILRTLREEIPVIVVAEEDSLELEKRARQEGIFYYLVHPIERAEVEAVLRDALRHGRS